MRITDSPHSESRPDFEVASTVHTAMMLCALLASASCAGQPPPAEPIRPVRVLEVRAAGRDQQRAFAGTTQAGVESALSFKISGTIQWIGVKVGDRVRSGQQIAQIDPKDYELQVEDARASLELARAMARNSKAKLARVRGLYESNNASQAEYDAALAEHQSTEAQVDSSAKRLELAELQLSYTHLEAPVDGAIAEVSAEVNENVARGEQVLLLTSGARPEVEVGIPETFIGRVTEGQRVEVALDALAGRTYPAEVTEVAVSTTAARTTFPVTVRFESQAPEVRPGMAARVTFRFLGEADRAGIVVPPFAVGEDRLGRFVFVVEDSGDGLGIAHRRSVQVGSITADGIEILDGLEEGDLLVTAGVSRIADGLRVKLPDRAPAGA